MRFLENNYVNILFTIFSVVIFSLVQIGCAHIKEANSKEYIHEITRYSDSGNIVEQYVYTRMTPGPINNALINFNIADTTYFMSDNLTVKRWRTR